jgi:DNA-binding IclR family transcriptional regulator
MGGIRFGYFAAPADPLSVMFQASDSAGRKGARMPYLESVDNSLRLLLLIAASARVGVSEAADHLGVAPSTAHRLLSTLRFRGFVVQGRDRTYRAGPALEEMVSQRMTRANLADLATPALEALREATDETCHFSVLVGRQQRVIASVESTQTLRVGSRAGVMLPAHLAAGGRMLLAQLPPDELNELYPPAGLPAAGLSQPAMATLRRELARCRSQGFAVNNGQTERGVTVVGVLVTNDEEAVGALSISMPTARYQRGNLPELVAAMRAVQGPWAAGGAGPRHGRPDAHPTLALSGAGSSP